MQDRLQSKEYKVRPNGGRVLPAEYVDYSPENVGNAFALQDAVFGGSTDPAVASTAPGSIQARLKGMHDKLNDIATPDGLTISNQLSITGFLEDGVSTFDYILNNPSDPSRGPWISFISESATGSTVQMAFEAYASTNLTNLGSCQVYNDNGIIVGTDFIPSDGIRYWFRAGSAAKRITFTPSSTNSTADYFICSHLEPSFTPPDQGVISAIGNLNTSVVNSKAPIQQSSFNQVNAISAGAFLSVNGFHNNSGVNSFELRSTSLPDGSNFYVEYKPQNAAEWNMLAWSRPGTRESRTYTINQPGAYQAYYDDKNAGFFAMQLRITNIGSSALPANTLTIFSYQTSNPQNNEGAISFDQSVLVPATVGTANLLLPKSLQLRQPKRFKLSAFRPALTTTNDVYLVSFNVVRSLDSALSPVGGAVLAGAANAAGSNYIVVSVDQDEPILSPMLGASLVRLNTAATDTAIFSWEF
jgi:hypothetical protein